MEIIAKIMCCLAIGTCINVLTAEMPRDYMERMQKIEHDSYNALDMLFARVRIAAVTQQELSNVELFNYFNEQEIPFFLSDARICSFDHNAPHVIAEKIDTYLQKKIREEMNTIVTQGADINGVKKFLAHSLLVCDLSEGVNCKELIRIIKNENKQTIDALKQQKEAEQKEAFLARENMLSSSQHSLKD